MKQFEFAREIDLVIVVPNCTMGLFSLHDAGTLALTVFFYSATARRYPLSSGEITARRVARGWRRTKM